MKPIILYDIDSTVPGKSWTPNVWKTRYSLNYKGLPHVTEWVEYPDIEALSKKLGTLPTGENGGKPYYSLPAIFDPNTNTAISESALIAEYLDVTYPDTPTLFPPGTHALQHAFIDAFMDKLTPLWQFSFPQVNKILNPPSADYFRRTREQAFGKKLEDFAPHDPSARQAEWAKVEASYDAVHKWLQMGKVDGPFLLGKEPGFVDFVVAGFVLWFRTIWGADSSQWKDIMSWSDGRWATLIQGFEKYETIT